MAAVAVLIVDVPSRSLVWVQSEVGVATPAFHFTTESREQEDNAKNYESKRKCESARHSVFTISKGRRSIRAGKTHTYFWLTALSMMLSMTSFTRFPGTLKLLVRIENAIGSPLAVVA